ncbi:MAG: Gfo/Idh/MocA family oxidoreductase [Victivallaceae bacterium]
MIKVAIIGVSGFGNVHYGDLIQACNENKLALVAAVIINQEEEKEKCEKLKSIGCRIFTDYKTMFSEFNGKLDVCFIPTGINLHAPMAIAAMRSGANVMIEKPAAATIQDILEMQKVERETGKFVAVGYQHIYQPEIAKIKKTILNGEIGQVKSIKCFGLWPRSESYYSRNRWAGKIKNGSDWILDSPFNNALAHSVNLLCYLAGQTFETSCQIVSVQAGLFRANPQIENADTACIRAVTGNKINLLFLVTHCSQKHYGPDMIIEGSAGKIRWNYQTTIIERESGSEKIDNTTNEMRKNIMNAILGRVHDKKTFICDLNIAMAQTLFCNGAHESSPVIPVPEQDVTELEDSIGKRFVIKQIDDIMEKCFNEGRLFSTEDYPWALTGSELSMTGYSRFNGGKTGMKL